MKKRVFILFLLVTAMQYCFAQDVIVTRNEERIEAKVEEISDTEVRYHRQDNLNGPVFVMSTSHVAAIVFANGEVKLFDKQMENKQQPSQDIQSGNNSFSLNWGKNVEYASGTKMDLTAGSFYYGKTYLSDAMYEAFLEGTCPDAASHYKVAKVMGFLAEIFLYAGSGSCGWAAVDLLAGYSNAGVSWGVWGVALMITSVPFYVVKGAMKRRSVEVFNENCSVKPLAAASTDVSLRVSPTGVGLVMNF